MRLVSALITILCLLPILLVFGGWVIPLSEGGAENWQHIRSTVLPEYVRGSFILILLVAIFAGSMGAVTAWFIARYNFPMRTAFSWMLILPFAMPSYVLAMSYGSLMEFAGPVQSYIREVFGLARGEYYFPQIRSVYGAAFVLALASFPYVYLLARAAFESQSEEWAELSEVFGHDSRLNLLWLSLAIARPFIMLGIALAIMEAAADIGVTQLFGVSTLSTGLYRLWYFGEDPVVAARLASLLVMIAALILFIERLSRSRARFSPSETSSPIARKPIRGLRGLLTSLMVFIPIFLGFVLPLLWLFRLAIYNTRHIRFEKIWDATYDSLSLCVIGAFVTVLAAFVMNLTERENNRLQFHWLASLGYAVPGVVIALSFLILQGALQEKFGWRLIFTGTSLGLILAYLVRFFSPAYQTLNSGFARISPNLDMVSASFGKSNWSVISQIYLPLLRTPIFHAALLVGIDIFKELPASLILRPFDVTTLAIAAFEFAGDDRPAEAAPYALILIALALVGVYLLVKLQDMRNDRS